MNQIDVEAAVDGDTPPVEVIIHLLHDHPDQWKIRMPEVLHQPSNLSITFKANNNPVSFGCVAIVGGELGIRLNRRDTKTIEKLVLRVMAWQALACSREAVLEGRNYMKFNPARMEAHTIEAESIKPMPNVFSDSLLEQYKRQFLLSQEGLLAQRQQAYGIGKTGPVK